MMPSATNLQRVQSQALIELATSPEKRKQLCFQARQWIDSQGSPSEQTIEKDLLSSFLFRIEFRLI